MKARLTRTLNDIEVYLNNKIFQYRDYLELQKCLIDPVIRKKLNKKELRAQFRAVYSKSVDYIADTLTAETIDFLRTIDMRDYFKDIRKVEILAALSIDKISDYSNELGNMVLHSILLTENIESRIENRILTIEHWIRIATRCLLKKPANLFVVPIIVMVISNSIDKLPSTKAGLSQESINLFTNMQDFCFSTEHHRYIKKNRDAIPIISLVLTSLLHALEKKPAAIPTEQYAPYYQIVQDLRDRINNAPKIGVNKTPLFDALFKNITYHTEENKINKTKTLHLMKNEETLYAKIILKDVKLNKADLVTELNKKNSKLDQLKSLLIQMQTELTWIENKLTQSDIEKEWRGKMEIRRDELEKNRSEIGTKLLKLTNVINNLRYDILNVIFSLVREKEKKQMHLAKQFRGELEKINVYKNILDGQATACSLIVETPPVTKQDMEYASNYEDEYAISIYKNKEPKNHGIDPMEEPAFKKVMVATYLMRTKPEFFDPKLSLKPEEISVQDLTMAYNNRELTKVFLYFLSDAEKMMYKKYLNNTYLQSPYPDISGPVVTIWDWIMLSDHLPYELRFNILQPFLESTDLCLTVLKNRSDEKKIAEMEEAKKNEAQEPKEELEGKQNQKRTVSRPASQPPAFFGGKKLRQAIVKQDLIAGQGPPLPTEEETTPVIRRSSQT